jgi:uncharacterized protein (DUF433 family)
MQYTGTCRRHFMDRQSQISIDADVLVGKLVIRGTRLAVKFIIDLLAKGWSQGQILKNYPGLTHEKVQACLAYASEVLKAQKVYPLKM